LYLNGEAFLTIPVNTGGLIKEKAKICMTSSNPSVGLFTYLACLRNDQFAQIWRSKTKRKTFPLLTLNGVKQETIRRQL
jgi:hypothetical protein